MSIMSKSTLFHDASMKYYSIVCKVQYHFASLAEKNSSFTLCKKKIIRDENR